MSEKQGKDRRREPTVAPGLEMDEVKQDATPEEIARGDYTSFTKLVLDRTPDD